MNNLWTAGLALAVAFASADAAWGFGGCGSDCCEPAPCCEMKVTYVDRVITCYRPQMFEREVTCVVPRITCREVVAQYKCVVMVPFYTEQQRECVVYRTVAKPVEREVTCCRMVPVTLKDPCTGCCYTSCKPEYYVQKVQSVVCELVPERRQFTVRVCNYKPKERVFTVRKLIPECSYQTVTRKVAECVMVPYQATVKVAVCVPCCK